MRIDACVVRVLSVVAGVGRWCGGVGVGGACRVAVRVRVRMGRVAGNGSGWIGVVHLGEYRYRKVGGFVCIGLGVGVDVKGKRVLEDKCVEDEEGVLL